MSDDRAGGGLAPEGLQRMRAVLGAAVDRGDVPGLVALVHRRDVFSRPGRYGWAGGLGTTASCDPAEDMVTILFTQVAMASPQPPRVFRDFWTTAYAAIDD